MKAPKGNSNPLGAFLLAIFCLSFPLYLDDFILLLESKRDCGKTFLQIMTYLK